jgi:hypothetical protein
MLDYYAKYIAFIWNNQVATAKTVALTTYPLKLDNNPVPNN